MTSLKFKKQIAEYLSISKNAMEICAPLQNLGIIGFFYIRMYNNGEITDISARPDWSIYYLESLFKQRYPRNALSDHLYIEEGINLWKLNQHNPIWQDGKEIFGYGNGISFCEEKKDYKEIYSFYSTHANESINRFYLNNLDFLRNFKLNFLDHGKSLIKQASNNRFILPSIYHDISQSHSSFSIDSYKNIKNAAPSLDLQKRYSGLLTSREIECLHYILRGFTMKQIAKILFISPRTIEFHINNIKSKLNCRTKAEIIKFLNIFV